MRRKHIRFSSEAFKGIVIFNSFFPATPNIYLDRVFPILRFDHNPVPDRKDVTISLSLYTATMYFESFCMGERDGNGRGGVVGLG